jgi:hypothetical protein
LWLERDYPNLVFSGGGKAVSEASFCGHFFDAYDPDSESGWDFHGCFWHGCEKCFARKKNEIHPSTKKNKPPQQRTYGDIYKQTLALDEKLEKSAGLIMKTMWECEWKRLKLVDPTINQFLTKCGDIRLHQHRFKPSTNIHSEEQLVQAIAAGSMYGFF